MYIDYNLFMTLSAVFIALSGSLLFYKLETIDKYVDNRKEIIKQCLASKNKNYPFVLYLIQNIGKFKQNEELKEYFKNKLGDNIENLYNEIIMIRGVRRQIIIKMSVVIIIWFCFITFLLPLSLGLFFIDKMNLFFIVILIIVINIIIIFSMLSFNKNVDAMTKININLGELIDGK